MQIDHNPREPSPFLVQVLQVGVAMAIAFAAIYISRQAEYQLNGALIGAWAFMGAYAATWLLFKVIDVRRYGWDALPPKAVMCSVTWKVLLVVAAYILVIVVGAEILTRFF